MNEQKAPHGIEWTRLPRNGTFTKGYTWNVVRGCLHGCAWTMPDGHQAQCYAKTVAENVARSAYPNGFEVHQFHAESLTEPLKLKEPAGIFIDSMSDLMGPWIPAAEVEQVLDVCRQASWQTFFLLTKAPQRLPRFAWPSNVWVGASSPPDVMHGHTLSRSQQATMLRKSLDALGTLHVPVRWMSFEPLSWECADIVAQYPGILQWVVVGAASHGRTYYPPDPAVLTHLLEVLDAQHIPVFFKGNLRSLPQAAQAWRAQFPPEVAYA